MWRRFIAPRTRTIRCSHCGGEARFSDKARVVEAFGSQVLAMALIVPLFLLPWWGGVLTVVGASIAFVALVDIVFPLVALEPFGSAADTRRAAIHFWLMAPIAFLVVVAMLVAMLRG
jgi:hypothetical protein